MTGTRGDGRQEPTDLELLRSAADGDDAAFHVLVDRYASDLNRVAISLSRNTADAEDLLQETFIGAYRGLKSFEGRSSVRTWLVRILTNRAAKLWHKSRHQRATMSIHRADDGSLREDASLMTTKPARSIEQRIDVMDILKSLAPAHREVLVLREIQGMSYEEMADALNVPRGTVESRLFRARADFRQRLEGRAPMQE